MFKTTAEEYRSAADRLYDQAMVELEAGDLRQASEKFWGAAAQSMKALAERSGRSHGSHFHFYKIIEEVVEQTEDERFDVWFSCANHLHGNFYEDRTPESSIQINADRVRRLIDELQDVRLEADK